MKKLVFLLFALYSSKLFAGQVGGSGSTGQASLNFTRIVNSADLLKLYQSAVNISENKFGRSDLFKLDFQNNTAVFGEVEEVPFEEVIKYSEELEENNEQTVD